MALKVILLPWRGSTLWVRLMDGEGSRVSSQVFISWVVVVAMVTSDDDGQSGTDDEEQVLMMG